MFERFTQEARTLVALASEHARRLGHRYVGGEHILLAAVTATGRYCAPGPRPSGHIPFTPASKKILELTLREAVALHDSHIGVEHITLALTTIKQGLVPTILSEAGAPAPALRAAILDRYRRAS